MPTDIYKIELGYNVTQLKGNTTPLTAFFVGENHGLTIGFLFLEI